MTPAKFAYARPESLAEATASMVAFGDGARVLAGGQSLLPLMNRRLVRPTAIVDLGRIPDLAYVICDGRALRIGALTPHVQVERVADDRVRSVFGIIPESVGLIGDLPVRTRGTFGGSLAHADPRSEWCLLSVLLEAQVIAVGQGGTRTFEARDFFTGPNRTALRSDEIVLEGRFPRPQGPAALAKFTVRSGGMAVIVAGAAVDLAEDGRVRAASLALGGTVERPLRLPSIEEFMLGRVVSPALLEQISRFVSNSVDSPGDRLTTRSFRRELAGVMVRRALEKALTRRVGPGPAVHEEATVI